MNEFEQARKRVRTMYEEAKVATLAAETALGETRAEGLGSAGREDAYGVWRYAAGQEMALFRVLLVLGDEV